MMQISCIFNLTDKSFVGLRFSCNMHNMYFIICIFGKPGKQNSVTFRGWCELSDKYPQTQTYTLSHTFAIIRVLMSIRSMSLILTDWVVMEG